MPECQDGTQLERLAHSARELVPLAGSVAPHLAGRAEVRVPAEILKPGAILVDREGWPSPLRPVHRGKSTSISRSRLCAVRRRHRH